MLTTRYIERSNCQAETGHNPRQKGTEGHRTRPGRRSDLPPRYHRRVTKRFCFPISQIRGASATLDGHHISVPYDAAIRWDQVTSLVAPLMMDRAPGGALPQEAKTHKLPRSATTTCYAIDASRGLFPVAC